MNLYVEFEAGQKHARKGAEISDTHEAFKDCGYLLTDEDVVIDIDCLPKETIKQLITWFDINTQIVWTDRGAHLYFEKPLGFNRCKNGVCALGFVIEMKSKSNTPNGLTIKRNGVLRTIENEGKRQLLPDFFNNRTTFRNLLGLSEGDERNNKLFAHKMALKNCEHWQAILQFINTYIFEKPLDPDEFQTVARTQDISKSDFDENAIADLVKNRFKTVNYAGDIWFLIGGEYKADIKLLRKIIYNQCEGVKTRFVDEVVKQIEYKSDEIPGDSVFDIRFSNGILRRGKWIELSDYDEFTPYTIDIEYDPDAEPVEIVDEYIRNLTEGDGPAPGYRDFLLETLAFPLVTDPEFIRTLGKFFMFRGDGANGKGTLLQIMKRIYGEKNCSALSIKQLTDDRFKVVLRGKLVNLGDDIEAEAINNDQLKVLKNITTCDTAMTRQLYKEAEDITYTTKLFFTTNSDIKSFEKGYAYKRRIVWMPMFNIVVKPDPHFISKITTDAALKYWIRLIVGGYLRLYQKGEWTKCEKVEEYNRRYHEHNNQAKLFIEDMGKEQLHYKTVREIKDMYKSWNDEDEKPLNLKLFKLAIWETYKMGFGVKRVKKDTPERVLLEQSETDQSIRPEFK